MPADRFSLLYLKPGAPAADSARARRRIYAQFARLQQTLPNGSELAAKFVTEVNAELGVTVPYGSMSFHFDDFFQKCELRDFLDSITLVFNLLNNEPRYWRNAAKPFLEFVARVLGEENMSYRVDSAGVVHYRVDEEFERNLSSAIESLSAEKFAQVRNSFSIHDWATACTARSCEANSIPRHLSPCARSRKPSAKREASNQRTSEQI
jgi:hypothetical protein